jgi:long-chain acyl-CoA synthetase
MQVGKMSGEIEIQSLSDLLDRSAAKFARRPAFLRKVHGEWRATTYGEFAATVEDLRAGLAALGVARGDRVAIISKNSLEWAAIAYATYGLGAVLVPMYESQRESDWSFIVRDSGAKVLFASTLAIFSQVSGFSAAAPKLRHVACLAGSYAAIVQDGSRRPRVRVKPAPDDPAALLYTSGTTGEPKGVVLSHRNVLSNVLALRTIIEQTIERPEEHRSLSFLPWAHAFGHTVELHVMVAGGACIAIAEAVEKVVDDIREVRPTVLVAVPMVFLRIHAGVGRLMASRPRFVRWLFESGVRLSLRRSRGEALSLAERVLLAAADALVFSRIRARFGGRLRFAICGAAALPREAAEFVDAIGIEVYEGYGLTEASPIVSANTPGCRRAGSVGRALPGVRIEIDRSASTDPASGEIVVYGPNVMTGYHEREQENELVFTREHGLRTGDLGYLDADDYLYVTGRIKERYKLSNGKYVVPSLIEDKLRLSPLIDNVMVCGSDKPCNVALVAPDSAAVEGFAASRGLTAESPEALLRHPEVRAEFTREIERLCAELKGYERVRAFAFVPEPFSQENGTLTPSLKLRRSEITERWSRLLAELYLEGASSLERAGGRDALTS